MTGAGPAADVRTAFGAGGADPAALDGGRRRAWRAGDLVLKRVDHPAETRWVAGVFDRLASQPRPGFRVPEPVPAQTGDWLYGGWHASRWVDAEPAPERLDDVLQTGIAFHAAVADQPRPAFLDDRRDPWAYGDRVAWEELPAHGHPRTTALLEPLVAVRRPIRLPAQAVHGDLGGNVLFGPDGPPVVIDWSVYHRPAGWALAVAAVDAVTWSGVPLAALDRWQPRVPEWAQLLVRALIYRIATREGRWLAGLPAGEPSEHYSPVIRHVVRNLTAGGP